MVSNGRWGSHKLSAMELQLSCSRNCLVHVQQRPPADIVGDLDPAVTQKSSDIHRSGGDFRSQDQEILKNLFGGLTKRKIKHALYGNDDHPLVILVGSYDSDYVA